MNKKKLELEGHGKPVNCQELQGPSKDYIKALAKNGQKQVSKYGLPKEKEMKKTKGQSIDIKQEVYNKLESYRAEGSADNLSDVINEFILQFEAEDEPEDDRYYCENCADYHD